MGGCYKRIIYLFLKDSVIKTFHVSVNCRE